MVWEGALCFGKGQQSMKGALGGVKHGEGDAYHHIINDTTGEHAM